MNAFYYDFNSPYSYLAAERISALFSEAGVEQPVWKPVALAFLLRAAGRTPWSMQPEGPNPDDLEEIRRRAADRGLPEVRYPPGWPVESYTLTPLRAAIYAEQTGRVIAFSLAAFRQQFAAGRGPAEVDHVPPRAAAACELHPKAVMKAIETDAIKERLREETEAAIAAGVIGVPTIAVKDQLFWGDDRLLEAIDAAKIAA